MTIHVDIDMETYPPEEMEPSCPICGAFMEWEECWNNCADGFFDMYEEDPLWYDVDDVEECDECKGEGGYWVCPLAANHKDVSC